MASELMKNNRDALSAISVVQDNNVLLDKVFKKFQCKLKSVVY